ncbi:response regulator transcription factor [Saccharibacillus sacchari]|uniref:Response regulator n=1 Tax=Saccharibacillus sacchari TaxID=456493 RepID=A0ACC6P7J3_9BACL
MYSVLILDDEEPLREAIRILGSWDVLGIGHIYEATDGEEGLVLLREHRIDLAMIDMKMPGMDGSEFLRRLEKDYPDVLSVVISGYNDFEYTRQAIRSHALDYLLKPVNRHSLNEVLQRAVEELNARRKKAEELLRRGRTLNVSLPKLRENVYLSIVRRSFNESREADTLAMIGASGESPKLHMAASLRLLNLDRVRRSRFYGDTGLLHAAIANVIRDCAPEGMECFGFADPASHREMIVVIRSLSDPGKSADGPLEYRAEIYLRKLLPTLDRLFGLRTIAGYGGGSAVLAELADSYDQARRAAGQINLLRLGETGYGVSSAKSGESRRGNGAGFALPESAAFAAAWARIAAAAGSGAPAQAQRIAEDAIVELKAGGYLALEEAQRLLGETKVALGCAEKQAGSAEQTESADSLAPAFSLSAKQADAASGDTEEGDLVDVSQWEQRILEVVEQCCRQARQADRTGASFHISDIRAYIDRHYFEEIKISMFTEKYFLSREYLMKLFKQEYGVGIHEYTQKLRMEKARVLLGEETLKIQEISDMLGYNDKNYFSKAFRNYYGVSPSEYRSGAGERTDGKAGLPGGR